MPIPAAFRTRIAWPFGCSVSLSAGVGDRRIQHALSMIADKGKQGES